MQIGLIHYIYILFIITIIVFMIMRIDIILVCILGLFTIGYVYSGSILEGVQTVYRGIIVSGIEFWNIIVIISLIVSMSNVLSDIGADVIMIRPINKLIKKPTSGFWLMGLMMMISSFILWPSPAVALIGAIILPAAIKAGLPSIWAACTMNIFGHGVAISADYFIQGAPSITAKGANISDPAILMKAQLPLWITMSIVTTVVSFLMMKRDLKKTVYKEELLTESKDNNSQISEKVKIVSIITPLVFLLTIYLMFRYKLKGGDAAALISGVSVIVMIFAVIVKNEFKNVLTTVSEYIKSGFIFGIKTFAPILIVGAFFFLGNEETSIKILGNEARGYLSDIGLYISNNISLSKYSAIIIQAITSIISGLGGAGFSALPLVGTISKTLSSAVNIDTVNLASLGQIFAMWVGGGTITPWGVIPVAAICKVDPLELSKKNIVPVFTGFAVTVIMAVVIF